MPVDHKMLLADCKKQLKLLESDLRVQAIGIPDLDTSLHAEYDAAQAAGRVGEAFEMWRGEQVTQAAVHWVLGCVFVRFLEDNALIDPFLTGPEGRGRLAEAAEQAFYAQHPTLHERDWLLHVFRTVAALPGGAALFDEAHNPVFRCPISPDAAKVLVQFWRRPDPTTGGLVHDFGDPTWDTRFLGDLYQNLSEAARKKYALLQTPIFVEEFILDRTLNEALQVLPLRNVTMIDPTVGSGHFALGAFARLLAAWEKKEPGALREDLAQRALDQVAGVDLNPFAVAIARFRLFIAAVRACNVSQLRHAPAFRLNVAVGDALLHGNESGALQLGDGGRGRYVHHAFSDEDLAAVNEILSRRYAVVVGNPPYITPKDRALNIAYRERYPTCYMKYALSVPFVERFWELAAGGGWVGQITANSFMKREFGKKLIEEFFPRVDLSHVVDSSGAYIPGHGTPTVILFGRARGPSTATVRTVMGIRGEPSVPLDAAQGEVWRAIVGQLDCPGSESSYVSTMDLPRSGFAVHPWSIGGGGMVALKQAIEAGSKFSLVHLAPLGRGLEEPCRGRPEAVCDIGVFGMTNADDAMLGSESAFLRGRVEKAYTRDLIVGDAVRDWSIARYDAVLFPYNEGEVVPLETAPGLAKWLWSVRTTLGTRATFGGGDYFDEGRPWWEWHQVALRRLKLPFTITFAEVATHNHFALDRGGRVFNRTAPIIKLPEGATEADHLALLGLLNCSTACFWLKQVCHNKGDSTDSAGARVTGDPAFDTYQFNATNVGAFPVAPGRPTNLAKMLDAVARERMNSLPRVVAARTTPTRGSLDVARVHADACLARAIALQEELDWRCYQLYGITDCELTYNDAAGNTIEPPATKFGERAFEIVVARRLAAGDEETTWFARHGGAPVTEIPPDWPADYRALVARRIAAIENDRNVALLERPEYKRRWNVEPWGVLERDALAAWLLDRLERREYWLDTSLQTTRALADRAALDQEFTQVVALYAGVGVPLELVIRELVLAEAVPFLPALRYTASGREKRRVWERTWEVQRQEDVVDAAVASEFVKREGDSDDASAKRLAAEQKVARIGEVGVTPRPPKYVSTDFQHASYWRMRGPLDMPKERFIVFPFCSRDGDDAPVIGWAGWNHLEQASALSEWYTNRTQSDGWHGERVVAMLAGMADLVPWLKQWHNEIDPKFGDRPGDSYATWLDAELQAQGLTRDALDAWEPPRTGARGGRKRATRRVTAGPAQDATE